MKKIFKTLFTISSFITIFSTLLIIGYTFYVLKDVEMKEIVQLENESYSKIYDRNLEVVETIAKDKKEFVEYEDIPPLLIKALISIEDKNFFYHHGIDFKRTCESFVHNLVSKYKHGGSTLTQQLIKNLMLSSEQSYKRKITEAYLALQLEKEYSKEEIITLYFNSIYFEQTTPGIVYASRRYFNKELEELSLPEIALLVACVKSSSYYNPLKYPERVDTRKDLVLENMYEDGYISYQEYIGAKRIKTKDLVNKEVSTEENFRFQAYLDIVYQEVKDLINKDPLVNKLEIYTYLDSSIQYYLDEIQRGNIIQFNDLSPQIGASIIKNDDFSVVGVIGGRNYNGSRLFNRAYNMRRQPASSIKPIFEYALAMEYLNYTNATTIIDQPYTYPGTNIVVHNADKNYLGNITLQDALGYSKNASALYTLEKVINKIGLENCTNYLKKINIMDEGTFTYSYGIGGMEYGVSPFHLAGAYAMIANKGLYQKPSTIRMIKDANSGKVLYERKIDASQIISEKSAYKISSTLVNIVNENYYGIKEVKVDGVDIGAKTGTNGYDKHQASALNYPSYADKDSWLCGFSKSYSMAVWSGWDTPEKNAKNYFSKGDNRRKIPKQIFQKVMEKINLKNKHFTLPNGLCKINVVKGANGYYLANEFIPSNYLISGVFEIESVPSEILPRPQLGEILDVEMFVYDDSLTLHILQGDQVTLPFDYTKLFGNEGFEIKYKLNDENQFTNIFYQTFDVTLPLDLTTIEYLSITPKYEKNSLAFASEFRIV